MTVSHLTSSSAALKAAAIAVLTGEGYTFDPTQQTFNEYLATALTGIGGVPISHLQMSTGELLAGLANELSDTTYSNLTHSYGEMLSVVANYEGEGGGGAPEWVPDAFAEGIYIDLVGGDPQGRAWVFGTGEVAVDTQLGSDPNTENGWAVSGYEAGRFSANGYGDCRGYRYYQVPRGWRQPVCGRAAFCRW